MGLPAGVGSGLPGRLHPGPDHGDGRARVRGAAGGQQAPQAELHPGGYFSVVRGGVGPR